MVGKGSVWLHKSTPWAMSYAGAGRSEGGGSISFASCCTRGQGNDPRHLVCIVLRGHCLWMSRSSFQLSAWWRGLKLSTMTHTHMYGYVQTHTYTHIHSFSVAEGRTVDFSPKPQSEKAPLQCVYRPLLFNHMNCTHTAPLADPDCLLLNLHTVFFSICGFQSVF